MPCRCSGSRVLLLRVWLRWFSSLLLLVAALPERCRDPGEVAVADSCCCNGALNVDSCLLKVWWHALCGVALFQLWSVRIS